MPETTTTEGLETDLTINNINYRVDVVVLEQLDAEGESTECYREGESTECYRELDYQEFMEFLKVHNDSQFLKIIEKLKSNNQSLRGLTETLEPLLKL